MTREQFNKLKKDFIEDPDNKDLLEASQFWTRRYLRFGEKIFKADEQTVQQWESARDAGDYTN
jgi:hypothetical protein